MVGKGFNPNCHYTVVLADPPNNTAAVAMTAVDTITISMVKGFSHVFNILFEIDFPVVIVFSSRKKAKRSCAL